MGKIMEKDEIVSVDSAKASEDETVWATAKFVNNNNSGQGLAVSDPSSGLAVSDLVWRPKIGDYMVDNSSAELRTLQNCLDQYARLSENLIFRNAHGWTESGYWASDRLKELIAQYPDWEITINNGLNPSVQGSDVYIVAQDPDRKAKYGTYALLSVPLDESIAITYILDMLVVKWHDKEWSFTFEKQDKDSFLNDFNRVLKIITSILDHITKRRKEDENMKKSLDIIAAGTCYKANICS